MPGGDNKIFSRSATHNVCRGGEGEVVEGKGFLLGVIGQLPEMIKLALDFGINIAMGGEGQENFYGKKYQRMGTVVIFIFTAMTKIICSCLGWNNQHRQPLH